MESYSHLFEQWALGRLEGGNRGWENGIAPLRLISAILAMEEMLSPSVVSWGKKARDEGTTEELPGIHEALQSSSVQWLPEMAEN